MSTRSSIWYGVDDKNVDCHIYWELAERDPGNGAPIYLALESGGKEVAIRCPKEVALMIRNFLVPDNTWEVM